MRYSIFINFSINLINLFICFFSCSLHLEGKLPSDSSNLDMKIDEEESMEIVAICGNGIKEPGEMCDDGNKIDNDECKNNCTFSCTSDYQCNDGNICNGTETCDTSSHSCIKGSVLPDCSICLAGIETKICISGDCINPRCGDGCVTDSANETCEPPGVSGCSAECNYECTTDNDCPQDGNICNGEEYCDTSTNICSHKNQPPQGTECQPSPRKICLGMQCTESRCGDNYIDSGSIPPEECDDGNNINGDGCNNDCRFSCHNNEECIDNNECNGTETCNLSTHICSQGTNARDLTPCNLGSGICCNGICVIPQDPSADSCCSYFDCPSDSCDGFAASCYSFHNESDCLNQDGCSWTEVAGYCFGGPINCSSYSAATCPTDCGCWVENPGPESPPLPPPPPPPAYCTGPYLLSCTDFNQSACSSCHLCTYFPSSYNCTGAATPCITIFTESECNSQDGCSWIHYSSCTNHSCK